MFKQAVVINDFCLLPDKRKREVELEASNLTLYTPFNEWETMERSYSFNSIECVKKLHVDECSNFLNYRSHYGGEFAWIHPSTRNLKLGPLFSINQDFHKAVVGITINYYCIRRTKVSGDAYAYFLYNLYKNNFRKVIPANKAYEEREEWLVYEMARKEIDILSSLGPDMYKDRYRSIYPDIFNDGTRRVYLSLSSLDTLKDKEKKEKIKISKALDRELAIIDFINFLMARPKSVDLFIDDFSKLEEKNTEFGNRRVFALSDRGIEQLNIFLKKKNVKEMSKTNAQRHFSRVLKKSTDGAIKTMGAFYKHIKILSRTPKESTKKTSERAGVSERCVKNTIKNVFGDNVASGKEATRNKERIKKNGRFSNMRIIRYISKVSERVITHFNYVIPQKPKKLKPVYNTDVKCENSSVIVHTARDIPIAS